MIVAGQDLSSEPEVTQAVLACFAERGYSISEEGDEWVLCTKSPTSRIITIQLKKGVDVRSALKNAASKYNHDNDEFRPREVNKSIQWISTEIHALCDIADSVYRERGLA